MGQEVVQGPADCGRPGVWPRMQSAALLLAVAGGVRLVAVPFTSRGPLRSDPAAYFDQAVALAHRSFDRPFYWPPGTSIAFVPWVAVFGDSHAVARAAAGFYSLLLIPAVMLLTAAVFRDRRVTLLAGWSAALYPPAILMAGDPQSHVIAGLLLCVLLATMIRAAETGRIWWWVGSGVTLGCLAATRPATLLLLLLPAGLLLLHRRSPTADPTPSTPARILAGLLVAVIASVAVMAPVAVHNIRAGAGLTLATNDSVNLFFGNNPYTPLYWTSAIASGHKSQAFNEYRKSLGGGSDSALRSTAVDYVVAHPGEFVLRSVNRARAFWGFDYYRSAELRSTGWSTPAMLAVFAAEAGGYVVAACLALAGFVGPFKSERTWRRDLLVAAAVLLYIPYVFSFSVGIYHFAVMIILMPVIGAVLGKVASAGVRQSLRAAVASRPLVVSVLIFGLLQIEYAYWLVRYA